MRACVWLGGEGEGGSKSEIWQNGILILVYTCALVCYVYVRMWVVTSCSWCHVADVLGGFSSSGSSLSLAALLWRAEWFPALVCAGHHAQFTVVGFLHVSDITPAEFCRAATVCKCAIASRTGIACRILVTYSFILNLYIVVKRTLRLEAHAVLLKILRKRS